MGPMCSPALCAFLSSLILCLPGTSASLPPSSTTMCGFTFFSKQMARAEARARCSALNASLMEPDMSQGPWWFNRAFESIALQHLNGDVIQGESVWIGAYMNEGKWTWSRDAARPSPEVRDAHVGPCAVLRLNKYDRTTGDSDSYLSGARCEQRAYAVCQHHDWPLDFGLCTLEECERGSVVFGDCRCGAKMHDEMTRLISAGVSASDKDRLEAALDVHFLNDRATSKYCANTGVASFPFTAWHRSEPSGLVAATTSRATTKYDFDAQNFIRMIGEYEAIIHAPLSARCAEKLREYLCYTIQPNARYDATLKGMHTCGVCRDVCTSFIDHCTVEERQSVVDLGVSVMPGRPGVTYLCHLGAMDASALIEKSLKKFLFPNCTSEFAQARCTSRDPTTCESLDVFPPPVAMFRDFPRLVASGGETVTIVNEIAGSSSDEADTITLRLVNGEAELVQELATSAMLPRSLTNAVTVVPNAKLVLTNIESALPRSSRDARGRVDQYTLLMDIAYSAPNELSGEINRKCWDWCNGRPDGCEVCGEVGSCCVPGGLSAAPECAVANRGEDFTKWGYEFLFDACISVPENNDYLRFYHREQDQDIDMVNITRSACQVLCDDDPFCHGFQIRGCGADQNPCGECRGDCDLVYFTIDGHRDHKSWVPDRARAGCDDGGIKAFAKVHGGSSCPDDSREAEYVCTSRSRAGCNLPFDWLQGYSSDRRQNNQSTPLINGRSSRWKESDRRTRGTCLLTTFNDADRPIWQSSFDTEGQATFANVDVRSDKANDRCTVLGVVEGCFYGTTGYESLPCGASFAVGRSPAQNYLLLEEYMLHQIPEVPTYEDTWIRVAISVDLVSGYMRTFMNSGNRTRKVADESWFLGVQRTDDRNQKKLNAELLRKAYLSPEGSLGLANEMLVATDCFATIKLGALAIHPTALPEPQLKTLTGPPGSPMSFLLDVFPRAVTVGEGGVAPAYLTVRLLRAPFGALDVSLSLPTSAIRVVVDPPSLRFTTEDWLVPQQLSIRAIDDDTMQLLATEPFEARIMSTEPMLWNTGLDDVVQINVRDNDEAALIASFDRSVVETNATNASVSVENVAPDGRDEFRHSFKPPHPDTPDGYACVEIGAKSKAIGTITLDHGAPPVQYTLRLGSEPHDNVRVKIEVSRLGDEEPSDSLIVASPTEIEFLVSSWDTPQQITLRIKNDVLNATHSGTVVSRHSLQHWLQSYIDSQYRTVGESGVLTAELLAVRASIVDGNVTSSAVHVKGEGLPAWTAAVFVAAALLMGAVVVLIRRRASAKVAQAKRKTSMMKKKFSKEKQRLEQSNAVMREKLKAATELVDKVMKEGGTAMDAFELNASDIVYDSPRRALGEGSFGTVYFGTFQGTNEVAVKTVRMTKINEKELDKFKSEIVIMAPLRHSNIVRLYGGVWNEGADNLCLVLEYCAKGSLNDFLTGKKAARWSWNDGLHGFSLGIARGLSYLHHGLRETLIHRDVKPANILVSAGEIAKLADFGESKRFDTEGARRNSEKDNDAATMTMVGTRMYCAPEVLLRERYNESADTFSFSLVMLCLLVGDILHVRKQYRGHSYIHGWRPDIPNTLRASNSSVVRLIESMWRANFRERPAMKDVVVALIAAPMTTKTTNFVTSDTAPTSIPTMNPDTVPSLSLEEGEIQRAKARYQNLSHEEMSLRLLKSEENGEVADLRIQEAEKSRDEMAHRLSEAEEQIKGLLNYAGEIETARQTITSESGISLLVQFKYDPEQKASVLGKGAFGTVYAIKSTLDGQSYAMKRLMPLMDATGSVDSVAMNELLEEVQKLSSVRSEYFVHYVTSSISHQYLFVVMERLHGVDFRDLVVARKALKIPFHEHQIERWLSQLAAGLAYLHDEAKLVHQDLHNGNVMITWDHTFEDAEAMLAAANDDLLSNLTQVKILDLGLASFKSDQSSRTVRADSTRTMRMVHTSRRGSFVEIAESEVCGFKAIRAPEMWSPVMDNLVRFDARADVWALGLLMCEAVLCVPIEEWYEDRTTLLSFGKERALQEAKIAEVMSISPRLGGLISGMLVTEPSIRLAARNVLQELSSQGSNIFPALEDRFFTGTFLADEWIRELGFDSQTDFVSWRQNQLRNVLAVYSERGSSWKSLRHISIPNGVHCEWKTTKGSSARLYRITVPLESNDANLVWMACCKSFGTKMAVQLGDRTCTHFKILQTLDGMSIEDANTWISFQVMKMPRPLPKRHFSVVTHTDEDALLIANYTLPRPCDHLVRGSVDAQVLQEALQGTAGHYSFKIENDAAGGVQMVALLQMDVSAGESVYHAVLRKASSLNIDRAGIASVKGTRAVARRIDELADLFQREQRRRTSRSVTLEF